MIVEVLYQELFIYGEKGNTEYLRQMFKDAKFVHTQLNDKPYFADNHVDLIIIEPISERHLEVVCGRLKPYAAKLRELIGAGVHFIAFNNALDILGKFLTEQGLGKKEEKETLNLFDYTTIRDLDDRYAELAVLEYKNTEVLAMSMGFSQYYGNTSNYIYDVKSGFGFNKETKRGGYRYKNAFLIEALGNVFMYNPEVAKLLLKRFDCDDSLPFEADAYAAHKQRSRLWKKCGIH
ncbi:hypothetical protein KJY78_04995 [Canibacter sp. lx-45]|uniref:hypothetical protein n=1 Tax=Canibacter zhuwentaonis TaxID=2837491 RepID=UPI001BDD90C1|nr:hypothetical protein [Canibacter zhuwentaonis]MBT1035702.1 hypothetical protein [Canibacter zhuwentaonis]